jgi:hypothetical protein
MFCAEKTFFTITSQTFTSEVRASINIIAQAGRAFYLNCRCGDICGDIPGYASCSDKRLCRSLEEVKEVIGKEKTRNLKAILVFGQKVIYLKYLA